MPVQPTVLPARGASGRFPAVSEARLLSALATLRDALTPDEALDVPAVLDRSALLACLSVFTTDTPTPTPTCTPAPAAVVASATAAVTCPPRCNFAGYCQMCGIQGCQATECITSWSITSWTTCDMCNGYGVDQASSLPCGCYGGLLQVDEDGDPIYYVAVEPLPVIAVGGRVRPATVGAADTYVSTAGGSL